MNRAANPFPALIAVLVFMCIGATASDAAIVWGTPTTIADDPTQVSTNGTPEYVYFFGGSSNANDDPETVNTVDFAYFGFNGPAAAPAIGTDIKIVSGNWSGLSTTFGTGGVSGNYGDIIEGAIFSFVPSTAVNLNNLVDGRDYEVQLWAHDGRETTGGIDGRTQTVDGNTMFINVAGPMTTGQFITGTFTASGTSQSFTLATGTGGVIHINAIQVRDITVIPTPAALPAGVGLLALTYLRRKRGA